MDANTDQLLQVPDVGPVVAESIRTFFDQPHNREVVEQLRAVGVHWPEGDFVRLMFHELAHQVVYAEGDTPFNESFATAVERAGGLALLLPATPDAVSAGLATVGLAVSPLMAFAGVCMTGLS